MTTDKADLPDHLIASILFAADLDVDARRALRMKPGRVERLITPDARTSLSLLFEQRSKRWSGRRSCPEGCRAALASCNGPSIPQHCPRQTLTMCLSVWDIDGRTLMQFEKMLTIQPRPGSRWEHLGGEAYPRGAVHCDVHTGEVVPRFIEAVAEDAEEDLDFDL